MHHKLLLGSSALVSAGVLLASASPASAQMEVRLQGYTEFGASWAEEDQLTGSDRGFGFFMDTEIHTLADAVSDTGVEYGGKVELEVFESAGFEEAGQGFIADLDPGTPGVQGSAGGESDTIADEAVIFMAGNFGRFEFGREDGAEDVMFVGGEDVQAGTGGFDGDTANLIEFQIFDSADAAKVTYFTPRIGGFQLGASYVPDTGDDFGDDRGDPSDFENFVGAGANWTGGMAGLDFTIAAVASWADAEADAVDDLLDWEVGFNTEIAGFKVGAAYVMKTDFNEGDIVNVGLGYGFGPVNASAGWVWHEPDVGDDQNLFVVSGDVGILEGMVLKGDVTYNTDTEVDADTEETLAAVVTVQLNY